MLGAIGRRIFLNVREGVEAFLERERGQLPLWLAVGFGAGIAAWFALGSPFDWLAVICLGAAAAVAGFAFSSGRFERGLGWLGLAIALGCGVVWLRSENVAAPRLERPLVTSFDGVVETVQPDSCVAVIQRDGREYRLLATRTATRIDWARWCRPAPMRTSSFPSAGSRRAARRAG